MLFPGRIYIARGPWHLGDICNICQIYMKTKKSPTIWARDRGTKPCGKFGAGYCITLMKGLDEGRR